MEFPGSYNYLTNHSVKTERPVSDSQAPVNEKEKEANVVAQESFVQRNGLPRQSSIRNRVSRRKVSGNGARRTQKLGAGALGFTKAPKQKTISKTQVERQERGGASASVEEKGSKPPTGTTIKKARPLKLVDTTEIFKRKETSKHHMKEIDQVVSACINKKGRQHKRLRIKNGKIVASSKFQFRIGKRRVSTRKDPLMLIVQQLGEGKTTGQKDVGKIFDKFTSLPQVQKRILKDSVFQKIVDFFPYLETKEPDKLEPRSASEIVQSIMSGDGELASLMIESHRNNKKTKDLIGQMSTELARVNEHADPEVKTTVTLNTLQFATEYLKDGSSVPIGGAQRESLEQELGSLLELTKGGEQPEEVQTAHKSLKAQVDKLSQNRMTAPTVQHYKEVLDSLAGGVTPENLAKAIDVLQKGRAHTLPAAALRKKIVDEMDLDKKSTKERQLSEMTGKEEYRLQNELEAKIKGMAKNEISKFNTTLLSGSLDENYTLIKDLFQESFNQLSPSEFDDLMFSNPDSQITGAFHIQENADLSNALTFMIQHEILYSTKPKKAITNCINLLNQAFEDGQYNLANALHAGLNGPAVKRLKTAWSTVDQEAQEKFTQLDEELDVLSSYKNLRAKVTSDIANDKAVTAPLHVYMSDMTFATDGNPSEIDEKVNLEKNEVIAGIKKNISVTKSRVGTLRSSPEQRRNMATALHLSAMLDEFGKDELYKESLEIQPRGTS